MIVDTFRVVINFAFNVLKYPITVDSFTFSLWQVLLVGILISIFVTFIQGLLE